MCSSPQPVKPSDVAVIRNLRVPMPVGRKVYIVARNMGLRVIRLKTCCGHPGEPGC